MIAVQSGIITTRGVSEGQVEIPRSQVVLPRPQSLGVPPVPLANPAGIPAFHLHPIFFRKDRVQRTSRSLRLSGPTS